MRHLLIAAALVLAACSSSAPTAPQQKANVPDPDFEIRQIVGPAEQNYEEGPIEVKFRLDIGNRADVPITLARVEIITVNPPGGAYSLDTSHRSYYFRKTIEPPTSSSGPRRSATAATIVARTSRSPYAALFISSRPMATFATCS